MIPATVQTCREAVGVPTKEEEGTALAARVEGEAAVKEGGAGTRELKVGMARAERLEEE